MCIYLNKIRNNYGDIIGYTIADCYKINIVDSKFLKEAIKNNSIHVENIFIDENNRIVFNKNIITNKYNFLLNSFNTWIPGGIDEALKIDFLDKYRTIFKREITLTDRLVKSIADSADLKYTKVIYKDSMDCTWRFTNGVVIFFDKFSGKIKIQPKDDDKGYDIDNTPVEVIIAKYFRE